MSGKVQKVSLMRRCRRAGFVRYSHLNVDQLRDLLARGYHYISPKDAYSIKIVHSSRGPKIADFDGCRYDVQIIPHRDGYMVRGVDLEGMFDSTFIEPAPYSHADNNYMGGFMEEDSLEDSKRLQEMMLDHAGGWFVRASRYVELTQLRDRLRRVPPRSLRELAANVVTSRHLPALPQWTLDRLLH